MKEQQPRQFIKGFPYEMKDVAKYGEYLIIKHIEKEIGKIDKIYYTVNKPHRILKTFENVKDARMWAREQQLKQERYDKALKTYQDTLAQLKVVERQLRMAKQGLEY